MKIRRAVPAEAEACWNIRNQAIRHGCKNSYDDAIIAAWTPENITLTLNHASLSGLPQARAVLISELNLC